MVYTEVKKIKGRKYYYRVRSLRNGKKFRKKRIYIGKDLSKKELSVKEEEADKKLGAQKNKKLEEINRIIPKIRKLLMKNKVKKAGIFGSNIKGEQKKGSDIDIIIEPPKGMGLGFIRIQMELENKLKKKVDLLTYNAIHPLLKKRILKEERRII